MVALIAWALRQLWEQSSITENLYDSDDKYASAHNIVKAYKFDKEDKVYVCKCCGTSYVLDNWTECEGTERPNYCPVCGRKVVNDEL